MQSTESQYIGNWESGVFVDGTWALQDGSAYNGHFGKNVSHNLFPYLADTQFIGISTVSSSCGSMSIHFLYA